MFITGLHRYGKYQALLYCQRSPLFIKPGKKTAKFAVQVCGSKKSFAVVEVQKITANVPQTCGFAVADHPLLFCGICSYGLKFKSAVPSTAVLLSFPSTLAEVTPFCLYVCKCCVCVYVSVVCAQNICELFDE